MQEISSVRQCMTKRDSHIELSHIELIDYINWSSHRQGQGNGDNFHFSKHKGKGIKKFLTLKPFHLPYISLLFSSSHSLLSQMIKTFILFKARLDHLYYKISNSLCLSPLPHTYTHLPVSWCFWTFFLTRWLAMDDTEHS